MTTNQQLEMLVKAHYQRDEERFRIGVLQIASHSKSEEHRKRLQDWTQKVGMMIPLGARELVIPLVEAKAEELILEPAVTTILAEIAEEHSRKVDLIARRIPLRTRLLFHGPPGCGKTAAASVFAKSVNVMGYTVSLANLIQQYMGTTGAALSKIFDALAVGALMVVDEIDAIGATRGGGPSDGAQTETNRIVNTLLTLMDQCQEGFLVATTNRVDMLDPALRRRFDEEVEFVAPSPETAARLISMLSARYGLKEAPRRCDITSFDAITKAVQRVARRAVMEELRPIEEAS